MDLGERLRTVRGSLSRRRFAESIGVSPASVENWESGRHSPPADALRKLCDTYGISESWLLSGRGTMKRDGRHGQRAVERAIGVGERTPPFGADVSVLDSYAVVPVYNVAASSGHGAIVGAEELLEPMVFPRKLLARFTSSPLHMLCVVFNRGESNEPDIFDGDAMLVDRGVERIVDDAFYVFGLDGALMVKLIERLLDGRVALKARNPAYREEFLSREQAAELSVFGRVIWRGGLV